jgi:hypothetical protein
MTELQDCPSFWEILPLYLHTDVMALEKKAGKYHVGFFLSRAGYVNEEVDTSNQRSNSGCNDALHILTLLWYWCKNFSLAIAEVEL